MRILKTTFHDMRFQLKHGFYFIYAVIVVFYIVLVGILPASWSNTATVIILFIDPAALGFFFIGGILLLEKGERVLDALFVSPLHVWEYIIAKALSLGFISVLTGIIVTVIGLGANVNIPVLIISLMAGSVLYTFVGLAAGARAKTVNQYMIITVPAEIVLSVPPFLLLFGIKSTLLEIMPGSLVFRLLQWCTGEYSAASPAVLLAGVLLWIVPAFLLAIDRMNRFLSRTGGEAYEADN